MAVRMVHGGARNTLVEQNLRELTESYKDDERLIFMQPRNKSRCLHYLRNKKIGTGAHGRFNLWSLQQIQSSTGILAAKVSTASNSSLHRS